MEIGSDYVAIEDYKGAETVYRRVIAMRGQQALGESLIEAEYSLGELLLKQGRRRQGLKLEKDALKVARARGGSRWMKALEGRLARPKD